jgi:hypothetical protein
VNFRFSLLSTVALASLGVTPAFADFVTNGSFETNGGIGQFNGPVAGTSTTATGWTVTGTNAGGSGTTGYAFIFDNTTGFTTGSPGEFGNVALYAGTPTDEGNFFYGADAIFHPSVLSQTITGLTPGATYQLTFDWAVGQQQGFTGATTDHFSVTFGSQTQDTATVTNPSGGFTGWFAETMEFVASSTAQTLSFIAIGTCVTNPDACVPTAPSAPPFALLDSVSLAAAVPESSTWAMMLLGLAGLGYASFRRGRRQRLETDA